MPPYPSPEVTDEELIEAGEESWAAFEELLREMEADASGLSEGPGG